MQNIKIKKIVIFSALLAVFLLAFKLALQIVVPYYVLKKDKGVKYLNSSVKFNVIAPVVTFTGVTYNSKKNLENGDVVNLIGKCDKISVSIGLNSDISAKHFDIAYNLNGDKVAYVSSLEDSSLDINIKLLNRVVRILPVNLHIEYKKQKGLLKLSNCAYTLSSFDAKNILLSGLFQFESELRNPILIKFDVDKIGDSHFQINDLYIGEKSLFLSAIGTVKQGAKYESTSLDLQLFISDTVELKSYIVNYITQLLSSNSHNSIASSIGNLLNKNSRNLYFNAVNNLFAQLKNKEETDGRNNAKSVNLKILKSKNGELFINTFSITDLVKQIMSVKNSLSFFKR